MARKIGPRARTGQWTISDFTGGLSEGSKSGIPGSFRYGYGLNYRDDPDQLTANKKLVLDSDSTVDSIPKWLVADGDNLYIYQDNGKLILRNSGGTYSLIGTISDSSGNGMALFDDYIYLTSDKGLHRYGPLSGTPALQENFLLSPAYEIDQSTGQVGGSNVYTLLTSINEGATHRQTFTPTADNISGVVLNIVAKGTGNVTVTVHDNSNALIGSKTITSANLPTAGRVRFDFPGIYDLTPSASYHIHAITSTGTTTIRSLTSSDMEDAEYATLVEYLREDVDQSNDLTIDTNLTSTYTLTTAINEGETHRQTFTAEKSNINAVSVLAGANGTGDWTLTVHDDRDQVIASKTLANANVRETKTWVKFEFTDPVDIVPSADYHFHVTSTVADGTIYSSTASNLEASGFLTHYQILQTDTNWHPLLYFPGSASLVIGNGNFLSKYDGIVYREAGPLSGSERLQFDKSERVRDLELIGDHLVILTTQGATVNDNTSSRLYFWDGAAPSYNAFKDVPGEGQAIQFGQDGLLRVFHGYGQLAVYNGALTPKKNVPLIGENKYVEVWPGATTNWQGYTMFGISDGDSTSAIRGVYGYGQQTNNYPMSLNLDFPISTGNLGSDVQVTSMLGLGPSKLYVGWKDDTNYGIDLIDVDNDQAAVLYESLRFDAGLVEFEKKSSTIKLTFAPLADGQSIGIKYKIDRGSTWLDLDTTVSSATYANTNNGSQVVKSFSFDKRWHELELQTTLATSTADAPVLTSCTTFFEIVADVQE